MSTINTTAVDALWELFEKRFNELDAILDDANRPRYERAEAAAQRDELSRAWGFVGQVRSDA